MTQFTINNNDNNQTIFKFLKKTYSNTPLSVIHKWIRKSKVKVNGKRIKDKNYQLQTNDLVEVYDTNAPKIRDNFKYCKEIELDIVYEDDNLIIVNKPFNLEVHSPINISLDDWVKSYLFDKKEYQPELENSFVISHVHRIDKLTSGLVIYAKNKPTMEILLEAIKNDNQIEKYYLCKVSNEIADDFVAKGHIIYDSMKQKAIYSETDTKGKEAVTEFYKKAPNIFLVKLVTGRKHQIRATLEYHRLPIINDFRYSGKKINSERMIFLSSYKIVFKNFENRLKYLNGKEFIKSPEWF